VLVQADPTTRCTLYMSGPLDLLVDAIGASVGGRKTCGASNPQGGTMRVRAERAIRDIIDGAREAAEESKRVSDAARERLIVIKANARRAAAWAKDHGRDAAVGAVWQRAT
jgi:hypothetical protein